MSSTEVIEAHVAAIRADVDELTTRLDAAVTKIDNDIKAAASTAEKDLDQFADHFEARLAEVHHGLRELRATDRSLLLLTNTNYQILSATISSNYNILTTKIEATDERLSAKIDRR